MILPWSAWSSACLPAWQAFLNTPHTIWSTIISLWLVNPFVVGNHRFTFLPGLELRLAGFFLKHQQSWVVWVEVEWFWMSGHAANNNSTKSVGTLISTNKSATILISHHHSRRRSVRRKNIITSRSRFEEYRFWDSIRWFCHRCESTDISSRSRFEECHFEDAIWSFWHRRELTDISLRSRFEEYYFEVAIRRIPGSNFHIVDSSNIPVLNLSYILFHFIFPHYELFVIAIQISVQGRDSKNTTSRSRFEEYQGVIFISGLYTNSLLQFLSRQIIQRISLRWIFTLLTHQKSQCCILLIF
jgi:hypothetical protein